MRSSAEVQILVETLKKYYELTLNTKRLQENIQIVVHFSRRKSRFAFKEDI